MIKVDRANVVWDRPDPLTDDVAMFLRHRTVSAGKRSAMIDLKHPGGQEILRSMISTVDVVHHNFTPPAAQKLGVSADAVREVNSEAIYATTSLHCSGCTRAGRLRTDGFPPDHRPRS